MADKNGWNIVQHCEAHSEPYFVFRAKDLLSNFVLAYYMKLAEEHLLGDLEFQDSVKQAREDFVRWQRQNPDQVRFPD